ncbi:Lanthionine synthetase C-like protein [Porphyromonadaceae bacterium KH3CP3RA]|nr:Lanthionine synthetase C-like protein [Porphyromonadaceae bacterium KH3CP3RA]
MEQKIDISKLVDQILSNIGSISSSGLYTGKAGLSLALFEASRYLNDENIENEAFKLLQESLVVENHDFSFENGLSGIGYVLLYLIENKFIDADFDEIFGKQYEQVMKEIITIRNNPERLLGSLKIIYFLSIVREINVKDKRINEIIKAIFEGIELYLSMQFFDWSDIYYVNNKTYVLEIYETYLKLLLYSDYSDFSKLLLRDYTELYCKNKILSSYPVGHYLKRLTTQYGIPNYKDVIESNINNGFKDLSLSELILKEKIEIICLIHEDSNIFNDSEQKELIIKNISIRMMPDGQDIPIEYQNGLARYLAFYVNRNIPQL